MYGADEISIENKRELADFEEIRRQFLVKRMHQIVKAVYVSVRLFACVCVFY